MHTHIHTHKLPASSHKYAAKSTVAREKSTMTSVERKDEAETHPTHELLRGVEGKETEKRKICRSEYPAST